MENFKYLRVFKMAGIEPYEGNEICSLLSSQILDRLTKVGFDRRLIKPILQKAKDMQGGINDENIDLILKDQDLVVSLIQKYCKYN